MFKNWLIAQRTDCAVYVLSNQETKVERNFVLTSNLFFVLLKTCRFQNSVSLPTYVDQHSWLLGRSAMLINVLQNIAAAGCLG